MTNTSNTTKSLRDRILALDDAVKEVVHVSEWGMDIEIRSMSGSQRATALDKLIDTKGNVNKNSIYGAVLLPCMYDPETGEQILQPGDEDALTSKNGAVLERLARIATRLSGISDSAVVEAEKNLDGDIQS